MIVTVSPKINKDIGSYCETDHEEEAGVNQQEEDSSIKVHLILDSTAEDQVEDHQQEEDFEDNLETGRTLVTGTRTTRTVTMVTTARTRAPSQHRGRSHHSKSQWKHDSGSWRRRVRKQTRNWTI